MRVKVKGICDQDCGLRVAGEVDTDSREFIHRVLLPPGAERLVVKTRTEVEEMRLVTFAPMQQGWFLECPVCRKPITLEEA